MIKAVFFDIDGTLLSHASGCVPIENLRALHHLRQKGIRVFIASGRHLSEIAQLPLRDLYFDGYVCLTGQLCLDRRKEVLYACPIDEQDVANILPFFEQRLMPIVFVEKERLYINYANEKVRQIQQQVSSPVPTIAAYHGDAVYQITLYIDETKEKQIAPLLPHCRMTRWNPNGTDIISRKGGKSVGMAKILRHYGISPEETMAFGDGENDLDMLRFAKIGVAMGNAEACVKQAADHVTDSVDEGGIWRALRYFGVL